MTLAIAAVCALTVTGIAQQPSSPRFEVASIKPIDTTQRHTAGVNVDPSGRVVLSGMSLKGMAATAFRHPGAQVSNAGDAWIEKDLYLINARAPENSGIRNFSYTLYDFEDERLCAMLQGLLIDRYQLRVHRETMMGEVYTLTRTDKPLGLQLSKLPEGRDPSSVKSDIGYAGGRWVLRSLTLPQLAKFASTYVVRAPVTDLTNVSGAYDYRQQAPDQDANYGDNTDVFLRMLRDVGLELKRKRGPIETLVIDSAQRPTPD